ncbi:hypothetical protein [Brumimicrobium aurantiacum]|uniref:Uncharacterized protein n=1 Tax=Brumimicrobium aurantiacum TaxID=1737063 RepID=A0A3E1EZU8_9FLAO|nr:hypothetical protein [Brumimicrobium aurantiacum]RFC55075.1 hypothetical protein DXU93_04440 [Brumimicrobium aurantiacum]
MKKILFLILCLITVFYSCDNNHEKKASEKMRIKDYTDTTINYKDTSIIIIDSNYQDNLIEYKNITSFEESIWETLYFKKGIGLLNTKMKFDKFKTDGPVYFFSDKGRLKRKAYYTTDSLRDNSLVENIEYKENGEINYDKSLFLSVVPTPLSDTIHVFNKSNLNLEITPHYWGATKVKMTIYLNKKKRGYVETENHQKANYRLNGLRKGVNELKIVVHASKERDVTQEMMSIRFVKVY